MMMVMVMIGERWCRLRHSHCWRSAYAARRSAPSGGKAVRRRHLLLVVGIVIVVAAVAAGIETRIAWVHCAAATAGGGAADAVAVARRCGARVEVTDATVTIGALVVVCVAGYVAELLLQLVVGLVGFAIVVIVVVVLHAGRIAWHRLRLHSRIVLDGGRRFILAGHLRAAAQMLYLRVVDKLRLRRGQLRTGLVRQLLAAAGDGIAVAGVGLHVERRLIGGQL